MPEGLTPVVVGLALTVATVSDLRRRRVPLWLTVGGSSAGLIVGAFMGNDTFWLSLQGFVIGSLLLAAFVLRGGFGAGDALLLGTIGAWTGGQFVLWTAVWTALVGAGLALVALRRGQKTFPYVPAIAIGTVLAFLVSK